MNARDVMTRDVVSVASDTPMRKIAALLVEKRIGGVPVIDSSGAPIGMVSEGDVIGRSEAEREARQDWWLTTLAEGEAVNPEFLASLNYPTARDMMSAPGDLNRREDQPRRDGGDPDETPHKARTGRL